MNGKVYRCRTCGNLVKVIVWGGGELSCCATPLQLLGQDGASGFREKPEPPLDLREVVSGGKSCWEFPESQELLPENNRLPDWQGPAAGWQCS